MKRLKENLTNILLIIVIIVCTVFICNKIDESNWELNKLDLIETRIQSNWWKLDSISDSTNNLHNIEEWTHKIYSSL